MIISLPKSLKPILHNDLCRLGNEGDGGYVVSKALINKADILIGLGLNDDWSFEKDFCNLNNKDLAIHCYDHTVNLKFFLKRTVINLVKFILKPSKASLINITKIFDYYTFFQGNHKHFQERIAYSPPDASIEKIFSRVENKQNVFLKIDIEGSEYRIIPDIMLYSDRIIGMVIEFHYIDIMKEKFFHYVKLLQEKYNIIHIHVNNLSIVSPEGIPEAIEISLERKDFNPSDITYSEKSYPITGLDFPNSDRLPQYSLRFQ